MAALVVHHSKFGGQCLGWVNRVRCGARRSRPASVDDVNRTFNNYAGRSVTSA
jgi:hypothetical protein